MRTFAYERPSHLDEAVAMLADAGPDARPLAGGTDLVIGLRDGTIRPRVVVDVKGITEIGDGIVEMNGGGLRIGARAVMTDITEDPRVRRDFRALAEAAAVVGSVQIRNRATLAGNIGNASPAADTAPALLAFGAAVILVGPSGTRTVPLDEVFVRSRVTTIAPDELIVAIELPPPDGPSGSVHLRRTRRRGHDLASVTVACAITPDGVTRLAYGSLGPRPWSATDETGVLADPTSSDADRLALLETLVADASPSARSMRASPDYRLAMLRVLGGRAVATALERLAARVAGSDT